MNINKVTENLKAYLLNQVTSLSRTNPAIGFLKPIIIRVLDKNLHKVTKTLGLIADDKGEIDLEGILTEMLESVMTSSPFPITIPNFGDILIGGGEIKFSLPFTNKGIILNKEDLMALKEALIVKE